MSLFVRLFGTLSIEDQTLNTVSFRRNNTGLLLAYLALHPQQSHSREMIADMLWEEGEADTLRNRLRQALSQLRRALREQNIDDTLLLEATHSTLRICSGVGSDLQQYRHALKHAERSQDTETEIRFLLQAAALYRAPLLAEFDEPQIVTEREILAHRHSAAMTKLAALQQASGDLSAAVETLQKVVSDDPCGEEIHAKLMHLYADLGQPSQVLKQYQQLEVALKKEFSVTPSPAMSQLVKGLHQRAAQNASLSLPATPSVPIPLPLTETPEPEVSTFPTNVAAIETASSEATTPSITIEAHLAAAHPERVSKRAAVVAFALLGIAAVIGWLRPHPGKQPSSAAAPPKSEPKIVFGQEKWHYQDHYMIDEKPNSEAKTLLVGEDGYVCATGIVETKKTDVDFLTVTMSSQGHMGKRVRFDSEGHDCDRAFSLATDKALGWHVAGESYFPPGFGRKEGWYQTLVHYDRDLNPLWHRYSERFIENDQRVRVLPDGEGGAIVGATEWVDKDKRRLVFSRYDAKGTRLYEHSYLPQGTETGSFRGFSRLDGGGFVVCGVVSPKQRKASSDMLWVTACFDSNGKFLWEKFAGEQGKNEPQGIETDQHGNIFVFGSLSEGDAKTGTLRLIPAIVKYDQNGKDYEMFSDPAYGGEIQITGWSVSKLGGGGGVNLVGNRLTATNEFDAFALGFSKEGRNPWSHDYAPFWNYRSTLARAVYPSGSNQIATVAAFSGSSASFVHQASRMAVIWSDVAGHPLSIFLYPDDKYSGNRTVLNASTATTEKIFLVGQTSTAYAAMFTIVAFPRSLP